MSVSVTLNGITYTIPQTGETGWGSQVTAWVQAVSNSTLQKTGGSFVLTAELDFGATYGLKSAYLKSRTASLASAGFVRMARADEIHWRDNADSSDLELGVNTSDQLTWNGNPIVGSTALTASRALQSSAAGLIQASSVTTTELGYVSGVTSALQTQLDAKQPLDSDLTAVAGLSSNGLIARTGSGTASVRTVTGTSNRVTVTNGDGVSGDPTLDIGTDVVTLTGSQTLTNKTITTPLGIVKGDVGLGNVDNTSDATKNSASATLTNKTLTGNIAVSLVSGAATVTLPTVTGTLATLAGSETLTNKTLTGNIAVTLVSGAATVTLPTTTGTLATLANAETLTNKTFDTANNTFKSGVAANLQVLTANGSGGTSWVTPSAAPDGSSEISNLTLACSVGSSAMTIALKTKAGTDATGSDIIKVGFRNVTAATGTYLQRTVTAALSTVISSGSTAGHQSAKDEYIYVYLLDNAGTVELAWSSSRFDEGSVRTSTAEGGAGAADSKTVLYSTTARTSVPFRMIGRLKSNQSTAGTWAAVPTEISLQPFDYSDLRKAEVLLTTPNGHGSTNNKIRIFSVTEIDTTGSHPALTYATSASNGASVTVGQDGWYRAEYSDSSSAAEGWGISVNASSLTTALSSTSVTNGKRVYVENSAGLVLQCGVTLYCIVGDVIRPHTNGSNNGTNAGAIFHVIKVG